MAKLNEGGPVAPANLPLSPPPAANVAAPAPPAPAVVAAPAPPAPAPEVQAPAVAAPVPAAPPVAAPTAPMAELAALAAATAPQSAAPGGTFDFSSVDLSQVQVGGIDRLLSTTVVYEAQVVKADFENAKSSGNPQISYKLKTTFPVEDAGIVIYGQATIAGDNPWVFKSLANACELLDPTGARCIAKSAQDFVGNIVRFAVFHDEYNGKWRNKVNGGFEVGFQTPGLQ